MDPTTKTSEPARGRRRWPPVTAFGSGLIGARSQPLGHDLVAGAVVAAMLVPQAMAYAALAGVPPQAGLYAAMAALLVYGLIGPSRSLSVGPVAIDSLLTAQGLAGLVALGTLAAQGLAATLALLVAGVYLLAWALGLGALGALLSAPVLLGFTHAAALVIALSQVRHLARLPIGGEGLPWEMASGTVAGLSETHLPTLAVGLGTLAILVLWRRQGARCLAALGTRPAVAAAAARAAPLLGVTAAAAAVVLLRLEGRGVPVVGDVPQGLPRPEIPTLGWETTRALLPTALAVAAIGFLECLSIARALGRLRREPVVPDGELFALGLSNAASAVVGGFPVTGGLSRSMVNHQAGATSGRASIVTALLLGLAVVAAAPWFHPIPRAALAAVVLVAVAALVDLAAFGRLWRQSRLDGAVALGTLAAVLVLGVELGALAGLGLGLVALAVARLGGRRERRPQPGRDASTVLDGRP